MCTGAVYRRAGTRFTWSVIKGLFTDVSWEGGKPKDDAILTKKIFKS